jgi:hypothetical protein
MFLNLIVLPGLLSEIYSRRKKEQGTRKKALRLRDRVTRRKKEEGRRKKALRLRDRVTRSPREGVIDRIGLGH